MCNVCSWSNRGGALIMLFAGVSKVWPCRFDVVVMIAGKVSKLWRCRFGRHHVRKRIEGVALTFGGCEHDGRKSLSCVVLLRQSSENDIFF